MSAKIFITECPRDAIHSWPHQISTQDKIDYLNKLLKVGFDLLDFGSFVSPKAIPQMADTDKVLNNLNWENSDTKLLAIVANKRGVEEAASYEAIHYLCYTFSISYTFYIYNIN